MRWITSDQCDLIIVQLSSSFGAHLLGDKDNSPFGFYSWFAWSKQVLKNSMQVVTFILYAWMQDLLSVWYGTISHGRVKV